MVGLLVCTTIPHWCDRIVGMYRHLPLMFPCGIMIPLGKIERMGKLLTVTEQWPEETYRLYISETRMVCGWKLQEFHSYIRLHDIRICEDLGTLFLLELTENQRLPHQRSSSLHRSSVSIMLMPLPPATQSLCALWIWVRYGGHWVSESLLL